MIAEFKNQTGNKVIINEKRCSHCIDMEKISHLTCEGYITSIHVIDNEKVISSAKLLKEWEAELTSYGFIRVNYSTIININYAIQYRGGKERIISLDSSKEFVVSYRRMKIVKRFFR